MQLIDGRAVYSATDLVGFLACEHLTHLERAALAGLVKRPMREDPELDRVAARGFEHEKRFLEGLRDVGREVVEITRDAGAELQAAADDTLAEMRRGTQVIYQATFFDGSWRGHVDFLVRVERPSLLGSWSYEVWDTKLARHVKGSAVLQMALYAALLERVQGVAPESMHVALGGSAREVQHLRVDDYAAYARLVRRMFEAFVADGEPVFPPPTRPDPVEHCEVCRWIVECKQVRRRTDDLSLVAGISGRQRRGLREHAVPTRRSLAGLTLPIIWRIPGTGREALERVQQQAHIQVKGEREGRLLYELLDPKRDRESRQLTPNLGLLSLPEPSSGDLFFDIEGDPFALDDGVDYLFGILEPALRDADGQPVFHSIWSLDGNGDVTLDAEKRAFERLIDFFMERLARDPNLHIYHYAPYEPTAIGRLMGRHGTREAEVDRLMRGKVFVDLFRAVRQGLRASVESYSIKRLEPLYGFERTVDLRDASSSILEFETWLELGGDRAAAGPEILERIEGYNRDDVVSNHLLRDWLESKRPELAATIGEAVPRPEYQTGDPPQTLSEKLAAVKETADALIEGVAADPAAGSEEEHARWLLGHLLAWHRREAKPAWWRYFELIERRTDEERVEEPEPIGMLEFVREIGPDKKSIVSEYRFPVQEHDIKAGRGVVDPATRKGAGEVVALDNEGGTLQLKRGKSMGPHPTSLVPETVVNTDAMEASLLRIGQEVVAHGLRAGPRFAAARDLLLRRPPPAGQALGAALARPAEPAAKAARRIVVDLRSGALAIQGPPGSGKSTTGADMIVDLVVTGRKVAVTSNSHKVIGNLLAKVAERAAERGIVVRIGQKPASDEDPTCGVARCLKENRDVEKALREGEVDVAGGTPWLWARDEFEGLVDALFVDEAGQVSLANVLAVSPAAPVLVLLGDPQQLDQPIQGTHPPGADRSALAHLLGDAPTMPPTLGLFLEHTWRLHPAITDFTSAAFYASKLQSQDGCEQQAVLGAGPLAGAGLRWFPVAHVGNDNDSIEEARAIRDLIGELLRSGAEWIDAKGRRALLTLDDILVITPYNAQVRTIAELIPNVRVGTVDKFQGQEAPISIYSMASSSVEEAPRGMEFLYNLHRLNVATSRARCVSLVIGSPELVRVRCRTPRQMRLANGLAQLLEFAEGGPVDPPILPARLEVVTR